VVLPNYVQTRVFTPDPPLKREYDIVFVGRIAPQKNVAALLEVVRKLRVRALIIGEGELKSDLRRRYADVAELVDWVPNVPHRELPGWIQKARIFVLPSLYEGHPKALIEAMSCAMPVLGAAAPGIRELLADRRTGLLRGTDAESLAEAVRELLTDRDLRLALGAAAREFVIANYSLRATVDKELILYRQLLARRGNPPSGI